MGGAIKPILKSQQLIGKPPQPNRLGILEMSRYGSDEKSIFRPVRLFGGHTEIAGSATTHYSTV